MHPIKIERGFTNLAQRELAENPPPKPPKRPAWRPWMTVAAIAAVVVLGIVIAITVRSVSGPEEAAPAPVTVAPPAQPPATAVTAVVAAALPPPPAPPSDTVPPPAVPDPAVAPPVTPVPVVPDPVAAPPPRVVAPPKANTVGELPLGGTNGLLCDYFEELPGNTVADLRSAAAYPGRPTRQVQLSRFELPRNRGDNYGARLRALLVPPASGRYRFAVCVDEAAELLLSSDDAPARARLIVNMSKRCDAGSYERCDEQHSEAFELVGGRRYYIELLMKDGSWSDHLQVGWCGPVSEKYVTIEGRFLHPWSDALEREPAAAEAAIVEQQRTHGRAYRFAAAAQALGTDRARWQGESVRLRVEQAIQRFTLLEQLRVFVQAELARAPLRGAWMARGGDVADVTGASGEGITVAPGRVVAWPDVSSEQMLRFVNQLVLKAGGDAATRGRLALAAAVFCLDFGGGVELALKYRDHALTLAPDLASSADRTLGEPALLRAGVARSELARLVARAADVPGLAESRYAALGMASGLLCAYWENLPGAAIDDALRRVMREKPAAATQRVSTFDLPRNHGDMFAARVQGYLVAPETGAYTFFIAADARAELSLSTDETAARLVRIARVDNLRGYQAWGDKGEMKSAPVDLVKGARYWVEATVKEEKGDDHLSVGWKTPGQTQVAVIPATALACVPEVSLSTVMADNRRKAIDDLFRLQALGREMEVVKRAAEALPGTGGADAPVAELQRCVARAQTLAREIETLLQRSDTALPPIRAALQSAAMRTRH